MERVVFNTHPPKILYHYQIFSQYMNMQTKEGDPIKDYCLE
jgi:hypothetical protein